MVRTPQFHPTWRQVDTVDMRFGRCSARFPYHMGYSRRHRRCIGLARSPRTRLAPRSFACLVRMIGMIASLQPQCRRCDDVFR